MEDDNAVNDGYSNGKGSEEEQTVIDFQSIFFWASTLSYAVTNLVPQALVARSKAMEGLLLLP